MAPYPRKGGNIPLSRPLEGGESGEFNVRFAAISKTLDFTHESGWWSKLRYYANKCAFLTGLTLVLLLPSCGVEFCASVPVLDSISPAGVQAGGPDFTLTLKGRNFHSDSSVLWNGFYLFFSKTVSENEIQVTVPAANILDQGSAQVWVVNDPGGTNLNGPCGGGPSAKLSFIITL